MRECLGNEIQLDQYVCCYKLSINGFFGSVFVIISWRE